LNQSRRIVCYKGLRIRTQEHIITVAKPTERSAMKVSSVSPLKQNRVNYISEWNFIGFGEGNERTLFSMEFKVKFKPAVASHHTPTSSLGHFYSFNALSYRSNLIDLFPNHVKELCISGHKNPVVH
jgi:hypothetical protein